MEMDGGGSRFEQTSCKLSSLGRNMTMIIMRSDGSFAWQHIDEHRTDKTKGTVEVSAGLLAQQSDLLDRLFAYAFDMLGLYTLELRVRATEPYADISPSLTLPRREPLVD